MSLDINFIASVAERDLDFIVMEEFSINEEFQDWFSARVYGEPIFGEAIGAWHSVSGSSMGETDILFVFTSDKGQRIALLIENKISASPQPQQGERYRKRGAKGINDGYWEEFRTCVMAPKRYLELSQEPYDCEVTYEEILAFFSSRRFRDPRFGYKAKIVQEAIEQNRRGYQPEYNDEMTAFVADYYEKYGKTYPELFMQAPKPRPANSDWIVFTPKGLPDDIWICHQLYRGLVKLFFNGKASALDEISGRYKDNMREDMVLGTASKSAAITITVPKVLPFENTFYEEVEKIEIAMEAIRTLHALAREIELGHWKIQYNHEEV